LVLKHYRVNMDPGLRRDDNKEIKQKCQPGGWHFFIQKLVLSR